VICPITITKYGNPVFSYSGMIDFGDGFKQNISLTHLNGSVINLSHPYLSTGTFSVQLSIPALNISSKTVLGETTIYGNKNNLTSISLHKHSLFH
jgi:hypothetical protein